MDKYKILVVDDETEVTEYIKLELEDLCSDFEVICKNTGYEGLKRVLNGDISLLLTDIAMPDMDGYELYSRTKEFDENLPIIMMTGFGYDPNHTVVNCKKAGLKDVIFKPFDINRLIMMIKKKITG